METCLAVIVTLRGRVRLRRIYCGVVYHLLVEWLGKAVVLHRLHRRHLGRLIVRWAAVYIHVSLPVWSNRVVQQFVQPARLHPLPRRPALQLATQRGCHSQFPPLLLCLRYFSSCSSSSLTLILTLSSLLANVSSCPLSLSPETPRGLRCIGRSYKLTYHSG